MQTFNRKSGNKKFFSYSKKKSKNVWPVAVEKILENHQFSHLQRIMRHTMRLTEVNKMVNLHLPAEVKKFCQVIQVEPTEIIIGVSSAAWLTRLRYWQPKLISALQKHPQLIYLNKINFRICSPQSQFSTELEIPIETKPLTQQNREMFREIAKMVDDPQLCRALEKLAGD